MTQFSASKRTAGFTLIELSIVLVIIGLIVGGVLTGKTLIRAAELRGIITDVERYKTAVYAFREKYAAFPGDMPNATSIWGIAAGTTGADTTCYTTSSGDARTCNGNGDGFISAADGSAYPEEFRFWQHLANAGLIKGKYTGITGPANVINTIIGTNCPEASIPQAGFSVTSIGFFDNSSTQVFPGDYNNMIQVGYQNGTGRTGFKFLRADEAMNVDQKLDDGKPGLDVVRGDKLGSSNAPICATSADADTAAYDVNTPGLNCRLIFKFIGS